MPNKIIGIDVGSYSVKLAVVERSFKSFSFVEFHERRIQYNELLTPEESKAIAVQGILDDFNVLWDVACVGFPSQKVTTRLLTFPFTSSKKITQTVPLEIETFIPFDIADVVLDHVVVWRSKEASKVMVVYVHKKDLVKELSMFGSVGVDPRYVCFEGIEMVNLVNLGMVPPEGAYAIIDIGHEKSTVTICYGRHLGYMRALSIAGKSVTSAIASKLSVPYDEAERMKIEMGRIPSPEEEEGMDEITKNVSGAIKGVMDDLLLRIRQTFFSYHETEDVPVEGIYLCGGTSRMPGLDRYLSDTLKLNVSYLNCTDFHFCRLDRADAHRHVIPQALSLALRGAAGSGMDVNLRRGEFAFKGDVDQIGGGVKKFTFLIGLIVFLALVSFTAKYYSVKKQIDKVKTDVVSLVKQELPGTPQRSMQTPKTAITFIRSRENELAEKMAQIKNTIGLSPLEILKDVSASLPPRTELKLDVTDLSIGLNRVSLSGIVGDFKAVDLVKQTLEKSKLFSNVQSGDVGKGVGGEVKFKVSMDVASENAPPKEEAPPKAGGKQRKE